MVIVVVVMTRLVVAKDSSRVAVQPRQRRKKLELKFSKCQGVQCAWLMTAHLSKFK